MLCTLHVSLVLMTKTDNEELKVKLRVLPWWPGLNFMSVRGDHCFIDELEERWEIEKEQTFSHKLQVGNLISLTMSEVNQSIIVGQTNFLWLKGETMNGWYELKNTTGIKFKKKRKKILTKGFLQVFPQCVEASLLRGINSPVLIFFSF